jgi:hypothetical protein
MRKENKNEVTFAIQLVLKGEVNKYEIIYKTGYALDSGKSGVMMRCDRGLSEASHGV